MTDWARFLPLSNRDRDGETAVSHNWSAATADLLNGIAAALDSHPQLTGAPTLRPEVSAAEAIRQLLTVLGAPWWMRWARSLGVAEMPSHEIAGIADVALASAVRARAIERAAPGGRANIHDLCAVVVLALDLRTSHGHTLGVDPILCGAVALNLALRAPQPQRSVVTARTFVAVEGGWQVGRGPQLRASAASIVLFLAGRGDLPSEIPPGDPAVSAERS